MIIVKKVLKNYFDEILAGNKTYELRLADWSCATGDVLELIEIDDSTKQPTGRSIRKRVGFVGKTKGLDLFAKEDVDTYGYQIISLLDEDTV